MAEQQTGGAGAPESSEQSQETLEQPQTAGTEMPALNRAERRAQAKGKKSGGAGTNPAASQSGARGPGGKPSGHVGQVRFPRTGHK